MSAFCSEELPCFNGGGATRGDEGRAGNGDVGHARSGCGGDDGRACNGEEGCCSGDDRCACIGDGTGDGLRGDEGRSSNSFSCEGSAGNGFPCGERAGNGPVGLLPGNGEGGDEDCTTPGAEHLLAGALSK